MRYLHLSVLALAALSVAACADTTVDTAAPGEPSGAVAPVPLGDRLGVVLTDLPPNGTDADRTALFNAAQASGARWVRLTAYWSALQPKADTFDWAPLAQLKANVDAAYARGLSVHLSLETTPAWVQGCAWYTVSVPFRPGTDAQGNLVPCGDPRYPPHDTNYNAWIGYVTGLRSRLGSAVTSWGIWNEPNDRNFYVVQADRNPMDEYRKLLWYGTQELRDAGGLIVAPEVGQGPSGFDWVWYLLETEAARIDKVGVHQYNTADCTEKDMIRFGILAGAKGKKVWVTEGGYTGSDEAAHARSVAGLIDEMADVAANDGCQAAYNSVYPGEWRSGDAAWERTFVYHLYANGPQEPVTNLINYAFGGAYTAKDSYSCLRWYATSASGAAPPNCYRTSWD